jgi:predicted transcriptional regulator
VTKRRSRDQLIEEILSKGKEPEATVIKLMAGTDWKTWRSLKEELMGRGLLIKKNSFYQTTGKGLEWLQMRKEMKALA